LANGFNYDNNKNNLERINLSSSRIGKKGIKILVDNLKNNCKLTLLDIGYMRATMDLGELGNFIEDEGALHLCDLIRNNNIKLRSLNITHNNITMKSIKLIIEAMKENSSLISFDYSQFGLPLNDHLTAEIDHILQTNRKFLTDKEIESILIPHHVQEIYSVYRTH
jgi:hypothetical protein